VAKLDVVLDENRDGTEWIKMKGKLSEEAWIECDTSLPVRAREWA
jgi:hypothetical protein